MPCQLCPASQEPAGETVGVAADVVGCALGDDAATLHASERTHVDDPVGVAHHVEIVFDDDDGGTVVDERLEHVEQREYVLGVQAYRRLVEYEQRIILGASHLAGELEALRLAAGEPGRLFADREIAQPQVMQRLQALAQQLEPAAGILRALHPRSCA